MNTEDRALRFEIARPIASIPHIIHCGEEVRRDVSYNFSGKYRQNDPSCVFQYTLSGSGIFENSDGEFEVTAGKGFLCMVSDPQTSYRFPADGSEPWHFVFFNFFGSHLAAAVKELTGRSGPVFQIKNDNPVIERMQLLLKRNDDSLHFSAAAAIASDFFNLLLQEEEALYDRDTPESDLARKAKSHIRQYLHNDINAAEVARALNISREHLSRIFSNESGITLYQYILREKILTACHLLKNTNKSNKEISRELGFSRPSHFNRTFLRLIKMTPRNFRQNGITPIFPA
jgi:AraC-like DNA-binding protein